MVTSTMIKNELLSDEFARRIQKLMVDAIPLLIVFATGNGMVARLFGFLSGASAEVGLVFAVDRQAPTASSTISAVMLPGSKFFFERAADLPDMDTERERLELSYGNSCLSVKFPAGDSLMIFFTSPPNVG
jgi:hypothetical protein